MLQTHHWAMSGKKAVWGSARRTAGRTEASQKRLLPWLCMSGHEWRNVMILGHDAIQY